MSGLYHRRKEEGAMSELIPLLNVQDVGRSIAFYATALDAKVESQWGSEGRVRWARIGFDGGKRCSTSPTAPGAPAASLATSSRA
jgi:hypothetical protein